MESERLSSLLETSAHVRSLRSSLLAANVWQQMGNLTTGERGASPRIPMDNVVDTWIEKPAAFKVAQALQGAAARGPRTTEDAVKEALLGDALVPALQTQGLSPGKPCLRFVSQLLSDDGPVEQAGLGVQVVTVAAPQEPEAQGGDKGSQGSTTMSVLRLGSATDSTTPPSDSAGVLLGSPRNMTQDNSSAGSETQQRTAGSTTNPPQPTATLSPSLPRREQPALRTSTMSPGSLKLITKPASSTFATKDFVSAGANVRESLRQSVPALSPRNIPLGMPPSPRVTKEAAGVANKGKGKALAGAGKVIAAAAAAPHTPADIALAAKEAARADVMARLRRANEAFNRTHAAAKPAAHPDAAPAWAPTNARAPRRTSGRAAAAAAGLADQQPDFRAGPMPPRSTADTVAAPGGEPDTVGPTGPGKAKKQDLYHQLLQRKDLTAAAPRARAQTKDTHPRATGSQPASKRTTAHGLALPPQAAAEAARKRRALPTDADTTAGAGGAEGKAAAFVIVSRRNTSDNLPNGSSVATSVSLEPLLAAGNHDNNVAMAGTEKGGHGTRALVSHTALTFAAKASPLVKSRYGSLDDTTGGSLGSGPEPTGLRLNAAVRKLNMGAVGFAPGIRMADGAMTARVVGAADRVRPAAVAAAMRRTKSAGRQRPSAGGAAAADGALPAAGRPLGPGAAPRDAPHAARKRTRSTAGSVKSFTLEPQGIWQVTEVPAAVLGPVPNQTPLNNAAASSPWLAHHLVSADAWQAAAATAAAQKDGAPAATDAATPLGYAAQHARALAQGAADPSKPGYVATVVAAINNGGNDALVPVEAAAQTEPETPIAQTCYADFDAIALPPPPPEEAIRASLSLSPGAKMRSFASTAAALIAGAAAGGDAPADASGGVIRESMSASLGSAGTVGSPGARSGLRTTRSVPVSPDAPLIAITGGLGKAGGSPTSAAAAAVARHSASSILSPRAAALGTSVSKPFTQLMTTHAAAQSPLAQKAEGAAVAGAAPPAAVPRSPLARPSHEDLALSEMSVVMVRKQTRGTQESVSVAGSTRTPKKTQDEVVGISPEEVLKRSLRSRGPTPRPSPVKPHAATMNMPPQYAHGVGLLKTARVTGSPPPAPTTQAPRGSPHSPGGGGYAASLQGSVPRVPPLALGALAAAASPPPSARASPGVPRYAAATAASAARMSPSAAALPPRPTPRGSTLTPSKLTQQQQTTATASPTRSVNMPSAEPTVLPDLPAQETALSTAMAPNLTNSTDRKIAQLEAELSLAAQPVPVQRSLFAEAQTQAVVVVQEVAPVPADATAPVVAALQSLLPGLDAQAQRSLQALLPSVLSSVSMSEPTQAPALTINNAAAAAVDIPEPRRVSKPVPDSVLRWVETDAAQAGAPTPEKSIGGTPAAMTQRPGAPEKLQAPQAGRGPSSTDGFGTVPQVKSNGVNAANRYTNSSDGTVYLPMSPLGPSADDTAQAGSAAVLVGASAGGALGSTLGQGVSVSESKIGQELLTHVAEGMSIEQLMTVVAKGVTMVLHEKATAPTAAAAAMAAVPQAAAAAAASVGCFGTCFPAASRVRPRSGAAPPEPPAILRPTAAGHVKNIVQVALGNNGTVLTVRRGANQDAAAGTGALAGRTVVGYDTEPCAWLGPGQQVLVRVQAAEGLPASTVALSALCKREYAHLVLALNAGVLLARGTVNADMCVGSMTWLSQVS